MQNNHKKILETLKNNGLLKLKFDSPKEVNIVFSSPTSPIFLLRTVNSVLASMGYSYFEIHYTLYYIYCVLKKNPEGTSLGLVPFYYEKAKEHHRLVENAKRTAKSVEVEEIAIERKTDVFKPNIRNTRLINIEEII